MAIDGTLSNFPVALDDWGSEKLNNVCEYIHAPFLNQMQHAVYNLERHTLRPVLTGSSGTIATGYTDATRPVILVKVYTVTLTGSLTETKTVQMPAFTAAEKALFGGSPLAASGSIHLQLRKIITTPSDTSRVVASLRAPIADPSGDSPWYVLCSPLRDTNADIDVKISSGTYVLTLMIVRT